MKTTKILIIEDNIVTLGDIEMRIGNMGYENIETAVSGEEAIEIAERFKPDLILSDINLGNGITGIEAVQQIKQKQDISVVYLTAYDDDKTLAEAGITEPYAYLLKPLQERELQISLSIAVFKHKTELELREAIATRDRFISILGHDLRNPFNTIFGFSDLLLNNIDHYDIQKIKKFVGLINNSAKQTFNLLNNLLEWSKSQQNKIPFNPQITNLYYIVNETFLLLQDNSKSKNIDIEINVPQQIQVEIDREMIKTVIRNLLSNAIKFTEDNGKIIISAKQTPDKVTIEIADTGIGMNEETKNSLFKIDKAQSTEGTNGEKGTGFGLLLCKEFIEKHNGAISFESATSQGSNFIITLPQKTATN